MENSMYEMLVDTTTAQLSALIGLALFFLILGLREIKQEHPQGYFFLTLCLFFLVGHFLQMSSLPEGFISAVGGLGLWTWLTLIMAPALIALFVLRALVGFLFSQGREGMVKLFFGVTLLCFVYMLGSDWPVDVKGILAIVWLTVLLRVELAATES